MGVELVDEAKRKVVEYKSELVSLASKLIQFQTVNPPGETGECAVFIKSFFDESGLKSSLHERKRNKTNLCVRVLGRSDAKLLWLGHLDVVPAGLLEKWSYRPFGGEVEKGRVYGRGASDMKGSCASAMIAARVLSEMDEDGHATVDFWFTCDEEVGAIDGTRWLGEEGLLEGEACVIGDSLSRVPEEPWIDMGCKGYMRTRLRARGKSAHGSMPFYGDNAVDKLILAIEKARQIGDFVLNLPEDMKPLIDSTVKFLLEDGDLAEDQKKAISRAFSYPTVSLNLINGGVKINVVPDSAEATFDIRISPGVNPKLVERQMFGLVENFRAKGVEAETVDLEDGYYERWDSPFADKLRKAVESATRIKPLPKILLGGTDAVHVKRALGGIPCLGFGAGIEELAHAPDEYVEIKSLLNVAKVYAILPIIY